MATSEQIVDQAKGVKERFDINAADIQSLGLLPDVEKANLADEYLKARREIDKLRADYEDARKRERIDYAQQAFGVADLVTAGSDPMTHMVSYRDAQDRAADAGSLAHLSALLARAIGTGDTFLARACAVRAFDMGWIEVVKEYEEQSPGWTELAQEARQQKQNEGLAAAVRFRLRKPTPIATLSESQMARLVARVEDEQAKKDKPKWKYV